MSIRIEVTEGVITPRQQVSKKSGEVMTFFEQSAWAYTTDRDGKPHPYPQRIVINHRDGSKPYPVGNYTISPESFYVGRFGRLEMSPRLVPIKTAA